MATYFFDFTDGDHATEDREGHDLPSFDATRKEALRALVEVYAHEPRDADHRSVTCAVRDDRGTVVYRASLKLEGARSPST